MPFYYDWNRLTATNAAALTQSNHFRALTVSQQPSCSIAAMYGTMRSGTAGGGSLQLVTCGTAGSGGTSQAAVRRHPSNPAANTTTFSDATTITAGGTPTLRAGVGLAQTGGMGGWVALQPEAAVVLLANAGANGNAEINSLSSGTAIPFNMTVEFSEF